MATKSIVTRIKNKVDTLAKWQSYTGTLLDGEIAVVRVPTGSTYTNPVTGVDEPVVELLMKVGDGVHKFNEVDSNGNPYLPWLSAKASDVYDWAKAATVEFNGTDNKIYFKDAGGVAVANVDLSALNAKISALDSGKLSDITVSQSGSGVVKSVEKDGTGKVKVTRATVATGEIADSAITTAKIADSNVTTAKIDDGAVTNAKLGTDISSDKINVGTDKTKGLTKKLSEMDAAIAANTSKLTGHTDSAINTLIDNKINALDGGTNTGTAGDGKYVSNVVQTNGKVATTYASFPTAGTNAGIVKLGVTGGAATYDAVSTLSTQVETNKSDIATLKTSVAGGVHFRGTVSAEPSASTTTVNNVTITAGDVVIYAGKEYICTAVTSGAPSWEQLGDVTRIGNLETKINNLDYSTVTDGAAANSKFVSKVTQTDGKIAATYARPSASDISYGSSSDVNTKLGSIDAEIAKKANSADVYTKTETGTQITNAINALDVSAPTASGTGTAFITSVSQTNGKISATKASLPLASDSSAGIVKLSDAVDSSLDADDGQTAATPLAVKTAYDKAAAAAAAAASANENANGRAPSNHAHGNITKDGTITSTAVTSATGVLVYDSANKIQRATAANLRTIIGAGTSSLTLGTTATTAAKGNHTHSTYEANIAAIAGNYVKITNDNLVNQAGDVIIFDCGGAD